MLKTVILAAGKGTRMKSDLPKVLHEINGKALVEYVIDAAKEAGSDDICIIVGHRAELVKERLGDGYTYAEQKEQLGTGHAVKCAKDFIGDSGDVLILCGDTPLIDGDTLKKLCDEHTKGNHTATLLSTIVDDPTGYGRIIRDAAGSFVKNVEHKDASEEELKSKEINGGMYLFDAAALSSALDNLSNDNAQGEYYLPDTLEIIKNAGGKVEAYVAEDPTVILGVNDKEQLKTAADLLEARS